MSTDFDYRAVPRRTAPAAIVAMIVIGAVLLVACGAWLLAPIASDSTRRSTTGTIVSYRVSVYGQGGTEYSPTIRYTVDDREYTFTPALSVTASARRQLPPGSHTEVRYLPGDPEDAVWVPAENTVALNFWGLLGILLGFFLIAGALLLRRLNTIAAERGVSGSDGPPDGRIPQSRDRSDLSPDEARRLSETDAAARAEAEQERRWAESHGEES